MVLTAGNPMPAAASCIGPTPLDDQIKNAAIVFVGTVAWTSDGDRIGHVQVESIWKGPRLAAYVDVHGSPVSGPFTATDVDRQYQTGVRYLFILYSASMPLQDNACSGTQPYTLDLAAHAPGSAQAPLAPTFGDQVQNFVVPHLWALAGILVVVVAVAVLAWLRLGRRSPNAVR